MESSDYLFGRDTLCTTNDYCYYFSTLSTDYNYLILNSISCCPSLTIQRFCSTKIT